MRRSCVPHGMSRGFERRSRASDGLDDDTIERLLNGGMKADDAPPPYSKVVELLDSLRAAATDRELAGQRDEVNAIATRIRLNALHPRSEVDAPIAPMASKAARRTRRVAVLVGAGTLGTLMLFNGLAAANALPSGVQTFAANILDSVGITVPSPQSEGGGPSTHISSNGQG